MGHIASVSVELRPPNGARTALHLGSGALVLGGLALSLDRSLELAIVLGAAIFVWAEELAKRLSPRVRGWILRLHEATAHSTEADGISSGTWFVTAVALLVGALPGLPAWAGVLVLAGADPAAAAVGRRFGRRPDPRGRTREGSLAFLTVATGLLAGLFAAWGLPASQVGLMAPLAGGAGALAERLLPVDDNLGVPVVVAGVVALFLHASN